MMPFSRLLKSASVALAIATIAAATGCGGGGGGSSSPTGGGGVVPSTPAPTASPAPALLSGVVVDFSTGAPLANMTATVGTLPDPKTCNLAQTQTLNVCGTVASTIATAKTASDGSFSITIPGRTPSGSYMLVVGPSDNSYASLHRSVAYTAGSPISLGTVKLTALDSVRQAWLADINKQRATVSVPTSFANLNVDEYAQELAQSWANDVGSGATPFNDNGFVPYGTAYPKQAGALFTATAVLALVTSPASNAGTAYADSAWMGEKSNCPGGTWKGCTFSPTTGHYINLSNTTTTWIGLGASPQAAPSYNSYPYIAFLVVNNNPIP